MKMTLQLQTHGFLGVSICVLGIAYFSLTVDRIRIVEL